MSELARANGWRGFDGLGERVKGGYEYRCDGMPSPMGCGEDVTVPRAWTALGVKKLRWLVCYGLDDDGTVDTDVVLTFCPKCAAVVATQSIEPHEHDWREVAIPGGSRWVCVCGAESAQPSEPDPAPLTPHTKETTE